MTTNETATSADQSIPTTACPACGQMVSVRAKACPRCGDPLQREIELANSMGTPGQGSAGNIVAALASLVIPGVGQLAQGRVLLGVLFLLCGVVAWVFWLGWLFHLLAAWEAAVWKGED